MTVNKSKIAKEFEEDKGDIEKVFKATTEVDTSTVNKHNETIVRKKMIIDGKGNELKSFYGKVLKITKKLHGHRYVARPGTKYEDIPSDFKCKVSFYDSDFE